MYFLFVGFLKNEKAFEKIKDHLFPTTDIDRFHTTICCLDNDEDEIKDVFGASMMLLVSKNDPHPEVNYISNSDHQQRNKCLK